MESIKLSEVYCNKCDKKFHKNDSNTHNASKRHIKYATDKKPAPKLKARTAYLGTFFEGTFLQQFSNIIVAKQTSDKYMFSHFQSQLYELCLLQPIYMLHISYILGSMNICDSVDEIDAFECFINILYEYEKHFVEKIPELKTDAQILLKHLIIKITIQKNHHIAIRNARKLKWVYFWAIFKDYLFKDGYNSALLEYKIKKYHDFQTLTSIKNSDKMQHQIEENFNTLSENYDLSPESDKQAVLKYTQIKNDPNQN